MIYLNIYLGCWFFTNFEPIQDGIDKIFERFKWDGMWTLLSCQYCLTLWITLAITQNWTMALLLSLIAQIHTKINK